MPTSLGDLDIDNGDIIFFTEGFRAILEQNLEYIKSTTANSTGLTNYGSLTDSEAVAFEGDFRKVCVHLNIPNHMVWVVMRVNGMLHYEDFNRTKREIIIPDYELIYKLKLATAVTQTNI